MSRFISHPFLVVVVLVSILFVPVFEAGRILGWSPTIAGWWSLFVITLAMFVWHSLEERADRAHNGRRKPSRR